MSNSNESSSVDSTETPYRYAGYANRLRTLLLSAHRYVAYTSDIGESFRPVAHPVLVRSAYGISWAYLLGDVGHEGYKAYLRNRRVLAPPCEAYKDSSDLSQHQIVMGMATGNVSGSLSSPDSDSDSGEGVSEGKSAGSGSTSMVSRGPAEWGLAMEKGGECDTLTPWPTTHIPLNEDYRVVMAKRALFQGIASMGLPALTIHSVVRYSGRALKGAKTTFARTWVPIGVCIYQSLGEGISVGVNQTSSGSPSFLSSRMFLTTRLKRLQTGLSALGFISTLGRTLLDRYRGIQRLRKS